jgi:hypothetical protein
MDELEPAVTTVFLRVWAAFSQAGSLIADFKSTSYPNDTENNMRMVRISRGCGAAIVMSLACISVASAADKPRKRISPAEGLVAQVKPEGTTPRRADGHPDLTGYYWGDGVGTVLLLYVPPGGYGSRGAATGEPDQATIDRSHLWNKPVYKPQYWQAVHDKDFGKVGDDPQFLGLPQGLPRMGPPQMIVQTDKWLVARNWVGGVVRFIPLDGRARNPLDYDQETYLGIGLGRWEGDTLVVESTGFNDKSWLAWQGYIHSNRMTITERFRREGDLLYWQFTVDDPEYLIEPWTSDWVVRRLNKDPSASPEEWLPWVESDLDNIVDPYERG